MSGDSLFSSCLWLLASCLDMMTGRHFGTVVGHRETKKIPKVKNNQEAGKTSYGCGHAKDPTLQSSGLHTFCNEGLKGSRSKMF